MNKVFIVTHWYDYEGSTIQKVYSTLEKAQNVLEDRYKEYIDSYNEEFQDNKTHLYESPEQPHISEDKMEVSYYGSNYSIEVHIVED